MLNTGQAADFMICGHVIYEQTIGLVPLPTLSFSGDRTVSHLIFNPLGPAIYDREYAYSTSRRKQVVCVLRSM